MESDERFKHLIQDPRFKNLRKKQKKVQIDERFQSMFTDERFTLKYSKDKRGRNQKKTTGDDLRKYYSLDTDKDKKLQDKSGKGKIPQVEEDKEVEEDDEDKEEKIESEVDSENESSEESESELSSSSDEPDSESETEVENDDDAIFAKIEYDWQPLDHDAETAEITTKRLAIQNLDWDHMDVRDIYTLINSIRTPLSVKVYVSEFGKERLKQEELEGPKEIVDMPKVDEVEEEYNQLREKMIALKSLDPKAHKINEYEDADEALDPKNYEVRERIRRYQLSRMKYFYAVAEFDSVESAELVYKELDGMEYEGSSLELDLRFIPDDIEFDEEDVKAVCDKVSDLASYKAPLFINSALQQTTVKFTWDETDIKRQEKLQRAYTKEEMERDDLEAYLASESEEEDEDEEEEIGDFNDAVSVVTANSEARVNKYKNLLKSLEKEEEEKKKVDIDVEWGNYSEDEENVGRCEEYASEESSLDEAELEPKKKPREKKEKKRGKTKRKMGGQEEANSGDDELDLLVMDVNGRKEDEFKFDADDERFKAVYESGLYNIDPSHPNFKRTQAFDVIAEKKRMKRTK